MDELELEQLLNFLPGNHSIPIPQLVKNYDQLSENPLEYFQSLKFHISANISPVPLEKFVDYLAIQGLGKKWLHLNHYGNYLDANPDLHQAILSKNMAVLNLYFKQWRDEFLEKIRLELIKRDQSPQIGLTLIEKLQPNLVDKIEGLILYLMKIQTITVIVDENKFFGQLIQQYQISLLVYHIARFKSTKTQSQLRKYMIKHLLSNKPEIYTPLETTAILDYFAQIEDGLDVDTIAQLLPAIELLPQTLNKKKAAVYHISHLLGELDSEKLKDMAWNYPRLRMRKLFLPGFIHVAPQEEIRTYWNSHHSQSSQQALLKELIGKTTDPFFLDLLIDQFQDRSQEILMAVNALPIEDEEAMVDFLLHLPDKYEVEELTQIFNGNYYYRRQPLYLLQNILYKLQNKAKVDKIRAKYRLAGISLPYE